MHIKDRCLISIITPCYNQGEYISETLESICSQTVDCWECIVIDDGSSDNSVGIVKRYEKRDKRIKLVCQENAGPSAARNRGASIAHGAYLMFLDSDNKIESTYLELGLRYMDKHPECTLYYSKIGLFGEATGDYGKHYTSYKNLLFNNSIDCCCIIKKGDFERVKGFDEKMQGYEDWELFIRLLYQHDCVYQDHRTLFYYRMRKSEDTINAHAKAKHEEIVNYIFQKHNEKFEEFYGSQYQAYFKAWLYEKELEKILHSNAYKLGNMLIKPFRWIKGMLSHQADTEVRGGIDR